MPFCDTGTLISPTRDGVKRFIRADCRRLSCPLCGPKKARKYRQRVIQFALDRKLTRILTLTLDPSRLPLGAVTVSEWSSVSVPYIQTTWRKMRVYLDRRYPKLQYIAVLELQKNGRAHLHVLVSEFIEKSWVQSAWHAVGGGWTDIRYADLHRIAGYVSKYLTKDVLLSIPKGKRRINLSRGMRLNDPPEPGWSWTRQLIDLVSVSWSMLTEKEESDERGLISFQCFSLMESG